MWLNPEFFADLVTFTEEILNRKLHFLCSVGWCFFNICLIFLCLHATLLYMLAYPPWKRGFFYDWLYKKRKDELSVFTINISIHMSSCLAAFFQKVLFALSVTDIIQRQKVWKMRLICHLKQSFWVYRGRRGL